jgi:SAM-dependent methyltransferase
VSDIKDTLEILACPQCKSTLTLGSSGDILLCGNCRVQYRILDDIAFFLEDTPAESEKANELSTLAHSYEETYKRSDEPWGYSKRAAELLRHEFLVETAQRYTNRPQRILDVGCSIGQLTSKLCHIPEQMFAMDVSLTAVRKARQKCSQSFRLRNHSEKRHYFYVGSAIALPFQQEVFDLIVLSDGLFEWRLSDDQRKSALNSCYTTLVPNGHAVFTDYLRPEMIQNYIQIIRDSPLKIVAVEFLYDRLWYQFESWFHMFRHHAWVKGIMRQTFIARALRIPARLFGKYGTRHICVVAKKTG